ncbi:MAG TPA: enoyl-CoA hydratase-related protein [Frankiaceae bacterium]|jgi:enoyl-CoA hydratase/carnithine racemase|nr:enoyl-CoA hydratase-related protein [Frankiaceae bacterium]
MSESSVTIEREVPGVATVVLDRPDKLNVFSAGMGADLSAAYSECDADPEIRVIVLTGRGRAFCAGADMAPESASFGTPGAGFSSQPLAAPAWSLNIPVIAAIQGHAIGIGFTIALQADIRIVAEDAKLAIPQARRGMIGDAGSHWTVRRFAGQAAAADLLLTGRTFRGSEAVTLGLASRALPAGEVLPAALEIASDMARAANPASLALSKRLLWEDLGLDEVIRRESGYHLLLMGTPDAAEGPRAWLERRDPNWTLRAADVLEGADRVDRGEG